MTTRLIWDLLYDFFGGMAWLYYVLYGRLLIIFKNEQDYGNARIIFQLILWDRMVGTYNKDIWLCSHRFY
jgi:hypothetical protein